MINMILYEVTLSCTQPIVTKFCRHVIRGTEKDIGYCSFRNNF